MNINAGTGMSNFTTYIKRVNDHVHVANIASIIHNQNVIFQITTTNTHTLYIHVAFLWHNYSNTTEVFVKLVNSSFYNS